MYKITLADGTVLKNLKLNGNNYIAEGVIDDAVFKDNMATVTITDGKTKPNVAIIPPKIPAALKPA